MSWTALLPLEPSLAQALGVCVGFIPTIGFNSVFMSC